MKGLEQFGGRVLKRNVTNKVAIKDIEKQVIDNQCHIDVLWKNAGSGLYGSVEELSIDKV